MNKKNLCLFFATFIFSASYAAGIKVAPIAVYDNNGNRVSVPFSPSKAIYEELEKHWFEGLLDFSLVAEKNHAVPMTIIDANKICMAESADYLLYGYIKRNETNWLSEIKLYSASEKKIIKEFFASDSLEHYDRLMNVLCQNILYGIEVVTGFNQDELKRKKARPLKLKIPASLFYWTPVDADWGSRILGIAGASVGLELYPPQPVMVSKEKLIDLSLRLNLLWDIGINKKDSYPLIFNTIEISLPVLLHIHFNEVHSLYGGIGFAYNIELMSVRPKYEDERFLYQNVFSFETIAGYELAINKAVCLFTEVVFDWHMMGDGFVSVKPCLGASFNIFKERQ